MIWRWEKSVLLMEAVVNIADGFGAVKEEKEKRLMCADLSTSWKCVLSKLFTNSLCLHTTLWMEVLLWLFCSSHSGTYVTFFFSFLDRIASLIVTIKISEFDKEHSLLAYLSSEAVFCLLFFVFFLGNCSNNIHTVWFSQSKWIQKGYDDQVDF